MSDRGAPSGVNAWVVVAVMLLFLSAGAWLTIQVNDRSEKIVGMGMCLFVGAFGFGAGVWQFASFFWDNRRWTGLVVFLPSVVVLQATVAWLLNGFSTSPPFREAAASFGVVGLIFATGLYLLDMKGTWTAFTDDEFSEDQPSELVRNEAREFLRFEPDASQVSWDARVLVTVAVDTQLRQALPPWFNDWFYQRARNGLLTALLAGRGHDEDGLNPEPYAESLLEGASDSRGCARSLLWPVLLPFKMAWHALRWVLFPLRLLALPISLPLAIFASRRRLLSEFLLFHSIGRALDRDLLLPENQTQARVGVAVLESDALRIRQAYERARQDIESRSFGALLRTLKSNGGAKTRFLMMLYRFDVVMLDQKTTHEGEGGIGKQERATLIETLIGELEEVLEGPEVHTWLADFDSRFDQAWM